MAQRSVCMRLHIQPSQYGPQYGLHAFQYQSLADRSNAVNANGTPGYTTNIASEVSAIPDFPQVDIVMTHGPPKYIPDRAGDGSSTGCDHLRRAICRARPRLHCFGHIHSAYGAHRVLWKNQYSKAHLEELGVDVSIKNDDSMIPTSQPEPESSLKNSSRRRGFARTGESSRQQLVHGRQMFMLNAAVMDDDRPLNTPWMVELDLPQLDTQISTS